MIIQLKPFMAKYKLGLDCDFEKEITSIEYDNNTERWYFNGRWNPENIIPITEKPLDKQENS